MKIKDSNKSTKSLVITSINKPNKAIKKFAKLSMKNNIKFIFVGDKKTPKFKNKNFLYLDLKSQLKLPFNYCKLAPINSYSRKNIGYLYAISKGAKQIYESDDDNYPKKNFFSQDIEKLKLYRIKKKGFVNIYNYFLNGQQKNIWPRGLPLNKIHEKKISYTKLYKQNKTNFSLIQRLCNVNPDVDAIYRLINEKIRINFNSNKGFVTNKNSYIPFNSQNTLWSKNVFPLMYLPSFCTMRSTDIWRAYIATHIMNKTNMKILFTSPTIFQKRNFHNLFNDFNLEIPVYKDVEFIVNNLNKVKIYKSKKHMLVNLFNCYKKLVKNKIFNEKELNLLVSWCYDIQKFQSHLIKI